MAKKVDDRSKEHLTWLLKSRSDNMQACKSLFLLIHDHADTIASDVWLQEIAQELTSVGFSLWRSVFLSDLNGAIVDQVADLEEFLGNLLSNNTIAYPQDKNTKEFTFRYYLTNAKLRLAYMAQNMSAIVAEDLSCAGEPGIKNDWSMAQARLADAIDAFGRLLPQATGQPSEAGT